LRKLTRRELALIFGAGALAGTAQGRMWRRSVRPGVVGLAEARAALGKPLGPETARLAMAGALAASVGAESGVEAAAAMFSPKDIVGIKVNCLAGKFLSPRVELVEALVDLLAEAGVDRRRIIVFERSNRELQRAGFTIREAGPPYRCIGTNNDYDREPSISGAIGSFRTHGVHNLFRSGLLWSRQGPRSVGRVSGDEELVRCDPQSKQVPRQRLRPLHRRRRPLSVHPEQAALDRPRRCHRPVPWWPGVPARRHLRARDGGGEHRSGCGRSVGVAGD